MDGTSAQGSDPRDTKGVRTFGSESDNSEGAHSRDIHSGNDPQSGWREVSWLSVLPAGLPTSNGAGLNA
jgi:hypothetical protein